MKFVPTSRQLAALFAFALATPTMASVRFNCPSESRFLSLWNQSITTAKTPDLTDPVAKAQQDAYGKIWTHGVPNPNTLRNNFVFDGKAYDLMVIKGTFVGHNPDYLDSYGVIFEAGQSEGIATIQTDTDRSDYICKEIAIPDRIVLPAAEFDVITIDSPQDVPVVINGVRYEHMYVISAQAAIAVGPHGETVTILRGE